MVHKILRWLLFGLLLSLLPLCATYATLSIEARPASVAALVRNGEILVLSWSLCASAMGELIGSGTRYMAPQIIAVGATLCVIVFCTLVFAPVAERRLMNQPVNEQALLFWSCWALGACAASSLSCLLLSET